MNMDIQPCSRHNDRRFVERVSASVCAGTGWPVVSRLVVALLTLFLAACSHLQGSRPSAGMMGEAIFTLSADADKAYRESRWIDAARQYQKLTEQVPQDAWAWFRLGNVHARQGNYDQAIVAYGNSLDRNSRQSKPWFNLATAYLLNAQLALMRASEMMHPEDPALVMIEHRLDVLTDLIHDRIEEPSGTALGYLSPD